MRLINGVSCYYYDKLQHTLLDEMRISIILFKRVSHYSQIVYYSELVGLDL